jgi:MOSC domain-containing protein YiiM
MESMAAEHTVRALWVRPVEAGPLEPRSELQLVAGQGIEGDHSLGRLRHVTFVFAGDWDAAAREIGRPVDPVGRRANVLVSGGRGRRYLGARIRIGQALVEIRGVTAPCPVMERAAPGMQAALRPEGRSGIWGRVLESGRVRCGDPFVVQVESGTTAPRENIADRSGDPP